MINKIAFGTKSYYNLLFFYGEINSVGLNQAHYETSNSLFTGIEHA